MSHHGSLMQLKFDRVSKKFGREIALRDVSFTIQCGTIAAILGANGAGKSTLLNLMAGRIAVSSGRVTWDDRLVKPSRIKPRRDMHLIDSPSAHNGPCTSRIIEMIDGYEADRPGLGDEAIEWMRRLNLLGLYRKRASELSKGQLFKIAMIGLFLVRPKIWLFDEPFSGGLDANGLQILQEEMKSHARSGGIVIFSTQWPKQALNVVDRFLVLDESTLVWNNAVDVVPDSDLLLSSDLSLKSVLEEIA